MTQVSDRIQGFVMYGARGLSRDAENILQLTREQQEQLGRANRDEDDWQMVSDVTAADYVTYIQNSVGIVF
jgi:hypothetical protein